MANRILAFLCAWLLLPAFAGAAEAMPTLGMLQQAAEDAQARAYLDENLADLLNRKKRGLQELRMGDWRLKAEGYAYRIPEGMVSGGRYGNAAVSLMADADAEHSFRTVITVTITGEDADLEHMTPEKAKSAFAGNFRRYRLLDFASETLCGEACVRITSVWSDSPELVMLQRLMNINGSCFIFTLMAINDPVHIIDGLRQFQAFCDSLVFAQLPQT